MENRIINKPTAEDAAILFTDFGCGTNDIIALSIEDFTETIKDATIAVTIEKSASGPDRLKSALSNIEASFAEVAPGLDLYGIDKILCLIATTENFKIKEMDHLTNFLDNFNRDTDIIWGATRNSGENADEVTVRLLLSYL